MSRGSHPASPASVYQPQHAESARGCALRAPVREESCSILEKHASLLPAKCCSLALQCPTPAWLRRRARVPLLHLSSRVRLALLPTTGIFCRVQRDLAQLAGFNFGLDSSLSR